MSITEPEEMNQKTKKVFFTITTITLLVVVGVVFLINPPITQHLKCEIITVNTTTVPATVETSCGSFLTGKPEQFNQGNVYNFKTKGWLPPQTIVDTQELPPLTEKLY